MTINTLREPRWDDTGLTFINILRDELDSTGLINIFEFEVIELATGEAEYINCDISFKGKSIVASREGLTTSELSSKYIASDSVVAYKGDTQDELLEALHEECYNSIVDSPLFDHV